MEKIEKNGALQQGRPDLVVIDLRTRIRQTFKRVEIIGDLKDRPDDREVGVGRTPNWVWRIALATGTIAGGVGLLEAIGYFLPKV